MKKVKITVVETTFNKNNDGFRPVIYKIEALDEDIGEMFEG